jgi:hypothetical protein
MNRLHKTTAVVTASLLAMALVGLAGCGSMDWKPSKLFSLDSSWPWGDDEPEEGTPVRMVGAWTDTVLAQPGKNPQRGFGGRLMFYGAKEERPIIVDGQLVIYAFDETGRGPTDNKPTRRYVFPPEQMPLHMSKSDMGASYSFWLPWDEAGGPKMEVSLVCRFEPKGGAVVTSEQTRHLLPGAIAINPGGAQQPPRLPEGVPSQPAQTTLESLRTSQRIDANVQQAAFQSNAAAPVVMPTTPAETPRQMSVTSIALPESFKLRNAAAETGVGGAAPAALPAQSPLQVAAPPIQAQPAANNLQSLPANATFGGMQPRPAVAIGNTTSMLQRTWPSVPAPQLTRPQLAIGSGQFASPTHPQQASLQQPASQPMPGPTPVTTKVSYPSIASRAGLPQQAAQPPSFHSAPASLPAQGQ